MTFAWLGSFTPDAATQRNALSVNTLGLFNAFDYCVVRHRSNVNAVRCVALRCFTASGENEPLLSYSTSLCAALLQRVVFIELLCSIVRCMLYALKT